MAAMRQTHRTLGGTAMAWSTQLFEDRTIVETTFSGMMNTEEVFEAVAATMAMGHAQQINKVLSDCSAFLGSPTAPDPSHLVAYLSGMRLHSTMYEAIILPPDEQTANNLRAYCRLTRPFGITAETFESRDDALAWLRAAPAG